MKNEETLRQEIDTIRDTLTQNLKALIDAEESVIKSSLTQLGNNERYQNLLDFLRTKLVSQLTELETCNNLEDVNALLQRVILAKAKDLASYDTGIAAGICIGGPIVLAFIPAIFLGALCVINPVAGIGFLTVTLPDFFNSLQVDPIVAVSVTAAVVATIAIVAAGVIAGTYAGTYWRTRNALFSAKQSYQKQLTKQSLLAIGKQLKSLQGENTQKRTTLQQEAEDKLKPLERQLERLEKLQSYR